MKIALIAPIIHAVNLAYCASQGDFSHLPWEKTPDELKKSIEYGVKLHIENPNTTPEQSHESWLKQKEADGWVYGETKDLENKTHPCILPYSELPDEQKAKDYLFKALVGQLKDLPDHDDLVQVTNALVSARKELQAFKTEVIKQNANKTQVVHETKTMTAGIAIAYIGQRHKFVDNLFGTQLVFEQGVPRVVQSNYAEKFLTLIEFQKVEGELGQDVSENDDTSKILKQQEAKKLLEQQNADREFNEIESIKKFGTKKAVVDYIKNHYGEAINPDSMKLVELKEKAIEKVRQHGVI